MERDAKSVQSAVLIVPSGFIANEPPPAVSACPVSVDADTAPSVSAITTVLTAAAGKSAASGLGSPAMAVVDPCTPPAQPRPPTTCTRLFQLAGLGSHTSIPMPGEVDGAPAGPGFPGPTFSSTMHRSLAAVTPDAVPLTLISSLFLNAFTSVTVVFASGLNAVFIESSQVSGLVVAAVNALELVLPPHAASNTTLAHIVTKTGRPSR